ncbi:MAG: nucleotidyltransferase family protein [Lachnospiraceae bacterium]|jgi:molybdenum cofactor cytidylyltransferase|nr:nucleotidyltransferase family protein [Lachnospiraceae bacterium]
MEIYLILLAAGNSVRFGGNKLLAQVGGKPMYRHIVDEVARIEDMHAGNASGDPCPGGVGGGGGRGRVFCGKVAVTQYPVIGEDLARAGYEVVYNEHGGDGIASSIRLGIEAATAMAHEGCAGARGFMFAVCDQPALRGETIEGFLQGFLAGHKGIGSLAQGGEMGNPAIFSEKYLPELLALSGDVGGRRVIKAHMDDVYLHEVGDAGELRDIDIAPLTEPCAK